MVGDVLLHFFDISNCPTFVRVEICMTIYMNLPIFVTREVDLTETIVDEGVAPVVHSYMLYPNERRSQYQFSDSLILGIS